MSENSRHPVPDRIDWPVRFHAHATPHLSGCGMKDRIYFLICLATLFPLAAGIYFFGWRVIGLSAAAGVSAVITDIVCRSIRHYDVEFDVFHALSIGLLLSLVLPPQTSMLTAFLGGALAVGVGKWMLGSLGNYIWPPALIGWVCLGLFFPSQISPGEYAFLTQDSPITGSLDSAVRNPGYRGYTWSRPYPGVEAWIEPRPVDMLSLAYQKGDDPELTLSPGQLLRDYLPPWQDTLWGSVGGGMGCTSTLAILFSGFLLLYFARLPWEIPVFSIFTIVLLGMIWPLHIQGELAWFPILYSESGIPIGPGLVMYHLTGGGLMLTCWLIVADPVATPLTRRGQMFYGLLLGGLIFSLRVLGLSLHPAFWSIILLSPLVPLIDRWTMRRVYGT